MLTGCTPKKHLIKFKIFVTLQQKYQLGEKYLDMKESKSNFETEFEKPTRQVPPVGEQVKFPFVPV